MNDPLPQYPTVASVRARGRVTVPKAARDGLSLSEGDRLLFVVGRGKLEVIPLALVTRRQLWTLTGSIRGGLEEAEDDVACGRIEEVTNPRKLKGALRRLAADDR
jgi:AbrB family looped-hinge helix DNA binding protein